MKDKIIAATLALCAVAIPATAKEKILVNSEVTTHIVMPENIKMVDLSTTKIIGNQCADNIVRIKPFIEADSVLTHYREGELMGTLTLIGERHLAQYDVVYTAALDLLLVCELHTHLGDVVCYLGAVLKGIVDEEIVAYRIDVVNNRLHAVGFRHHLIVFSTAAIYGPGVTCHFRLRHGYLRIDVGVQTGVWHTVGCV